MMVALYIVIGALAGVISGMGIGGGVILIPALVFFTSISQHGAQAVNLLYFLPTAVAALIVEMCIRDRREEGKTIILASHSKEDIDILCDTVCELDHGRLIHSRAAESEMECINCPAAE